MLQHALYPLRTVLGQSVQITNRAFTLIHQSKASRDLNVSYRLIHRSGVAETRHGDVYQRYYPTFQINSVIYRAHLGDVPLPAPSDLPFDSGAPLVSLFAHSQPAGDAGISRRLSVQLKLELAEERQVGGICFAGLPYLPSSISEVGESAANFGLPREWRLTCASDDSEFLDGETSTSLQMVLGHSGFHYLLIEPTSTKELFLHLSDFPLFVTRVQADADAEPSIERCYGFAVPYFYVFEYREGSRYRPRVPGGLLTAQTRTKPERPPVGPLVPGRERRTPREILAEFLGDSAYLHIVDAERGQRAVIPFTAASIFGRQRRFGLQDGRSLAEAFVSGEMSEQESVTLYFAQGEEHRRCIAGLRLQLWFVPEQLERLGDLGEAFANFTDPQQVGTLLEQVLQLPEEIRFCRRVGIRVAEIDPLEGVSPVQVDIDGKHATVLYEGDLNTVEELRNLLLRGLRFDRPTLSKHLAIEFTNLGGEPGQIVLSSMTLAQSANVSVGTRPSRTQQVHSLHFRLIGDDLANDYGHLGREGFTLSIEHFVAGNRKSVLFSATSLLDLLQLGRARMFANGRRRAVEEEIGEIVNRPGERENFEQRETHVDTSGWRRSDTGHGVDDLDKWRTKPGKDRDFTAFSNQEVRTHTEVLSPNEDVNEWKSNAAIINALFIAHAFGTSATRQKINLRGGWDNWQLPFLGETQLLVPTSDRVRLVEGFGDVWRGIVDGDDALVVTGMKTISSNPFGINNISTQFLDAIDSLSENPLTILSNVLDVFVPLMGTFAAGGSPTIIPLTAMNSLGLSVSVSPGGLGLSFSGSGGLLLPSVSYTNSFGTQGSITKQASRTGHAYSQFRNASYDEATADSYVLNGKSRRRVRRLEVEGTNRERVRGGEVMWQGELLDIVTGTIPLNLTLPATASKAYRTGDESIRVRLNGGVGRSIKVDVWFDVLEEVVRDDY